MIKYLFILLLLINISSYSFAGEWQVCNQMTRYEPQTGTAFMPGIDIHGETVAPADLNSVNTPVPDVVVIPVEINFLEHIEQDLPDGLKLEGDVARVEIYNDGRVMYNGQDISGAVEAACKEQNNTTGYNDLPVPDKETD